MALIIDRENKKGGELSAYERALLDEVIREDAEMLRELVKDD